MEKIVNLLDRRSMTDQLRGLTTLENSPQPFNELWRAIEQPHRLGGWREIYLDFHDRSVVHEVGDGRHEQNDQC